MFLLKVRLKLRKVYQKLRRNSAGLPYQNQVTRSTALPQKTYKYGLFCTRRDRATFCPDTEQFSISSLKT